MSDQTLKPCTFEEFETFLDEYAHAIRENEHSGYGMGKYTQQAVLDARQVILAAWNARVQPMSLERAMEIVKEAFDYRVSVDRNGLRLKGVHYDFMFWCTAEQLEAIARVMREGTKIDTPQTVP